MAATATANAHISPHPPSPGQNGSGDAWQVPRAAEPESRASSVATCTRPEGTARKTQPSKMHSWTL
eukprot:6207427-Pleurochrysis_carterae.AAC.2